MPPVDNIAYLSYGSGPHAHETVFSMLTLGRFPREDLRGTRVIILTDQADFFGSFGLEVVPISQATFEEWKGPFGFGHRCKIMAIRQVIDQFGGKCLLVDGDTYFLGSPRRVLDRIAPGHSVMHMVHGRLAHSKLEMCHRLGELLADGHAGGYSSAGPRRGPMTVQWNAGVVGIDPSDVYLLDDVLSMVDSILPRYVAPAVEQLAFSVILAERTQLRPSRDTIFHYNVSPDRARFRQMIPKLLTRSEGLPPAERAAWLYAHRLRLAWRAKARVLAKDVLNVLHLMPARDRCDCQ